MQTLASPQEPAAASASAAAAAESSAAINQATVVCGIPAAQQASRQADSEALRMPVDSGPHNTSFSIPACLGTDSITAEPVAAGSHAELGLDEGDCVICWAAGAEVIFEPCGHLCACQSCAQPFLVQALECPMCRASVISGIFVEL